MCGIAGIVQTNGEVDRERLVPMLRSLAHRGPEEEGVWHGGNVALGQRRLAIIDLSPGGHQPMLGPDGKIVLTFNGELYNYQELKKEMKDLGHSFRTESDTEVLLHAYLEWGIDCLQHLNGMFAFALWDGNKQELFAARDRVGEKPFKYYFDGRRLVFASEVKAILQDKTIPREVDWQAVDLALSFRYVPAPLTGFKNIQKLPAGNYLIWKKGILEIKPYWSPAADRLESRSAAEWKKEFWDLFVDSVKHRMISDVPLGAFLSGGIDSTSVVAAMQLVAKNPITTFVISFDKESEDRKFAKLAAEFYGTTHHEIEIADIDFSSALQKLAYFYDEPFFDQSALPSLLINEHIKKYATVALSGDGGDELFGGYPSYKFAGLLAGLHRLPKFVYQNVLSSASGFSNNLQYRSEIIGRDFVDAYTEYFSLWKSRLPISRRYITKEDLYTDLLKSKIRPQEDVKYMTEWFQGQQRDWPNRAMLADLRGRLPDGYLAKVDFASMASAVEVRAPFIDYRLVEKSQQLPSSLKLRAGQGKFIWKEIVKDKLPRAIIDRKKMGFALPMHKILLKELRPAVEDLVIDGNSEISRMLERKTILKLWEDHLAGKADYSNHIWSLLTLELWLKNYLAK